MSSKTLMNTMFLLFILIWLVGLSNGECEFKAIFNFGDSNSDTGGFFSAFPAEGPPFGMTYFKKPVGRASDGRLVIDFLAQAIGIPFLSPFLQSIGSDFKHGANYATLASTVLFPNTSVFVSGISPFSLAIQLNQMKQFVAKVTEADQKDMNLPSPDVFGKSLYTFYIGQNDFTSKLADIGKGGMEEFLPQVVSQIVAAIKELYNLGGRTFMVLNLAPVGCYPAFLVGLPHNSTERDEFGCKVSYNNAVVNYNNMLKESLKQTRENLSDASVIYVDTYTVLLELFQHPSSHGLEYGTKACCGYGGGEYNFNPKVYCGESKEIDGKKVTATACDDPYKYVSWDGIHTTEAANKLITHAILNGSYFDPPFPFQQHCDLQPIG
ncbi:GDSL esterase/lipase At4g01130 isoform X2 [Lathyrus oleraceus]|uniref:GDSL esterase/lipase At4g01130 isoform X2 n=1 Tax=Pisum sativum TaxID=3888 RepID=UPI0021D10C32|nr:GDSL esterase/lipase At4g01130-like isoform X2 [Pisum sativum]